MSGAEQPTATVALAALPLFPLNTVLFPDGTLNLQIFEVRYLDLIGKCYKNGAPFGVVSLLQGREVRSRDVGAPSGEAFANEVFADVGTLAHIAEFAAPQAGLMVVRCSGGARFRIRSRSQLKHGLWVADVDVLPIEVPTPIPADLQPIAHALARLIEQQQDSTGMLEFAPIAPPYRLDDCAWVANRWCDLLAMPASARQSLLQLESPLLRLELVGDLLIQRSAP
jgi:Lon protease-like protein